MEMRASVRVRVNLPEKSNLPVERSVYVIDGTFPQFHIVN